MNHIVLVGRTTKEVELKYLQGTGTPVASFTVAVNRNYTKKDGTKETDFIPVEVMGKAAEFCANYISKGRLVAIQGSLRVDKYQTQTGENRTFTKVSANSVQALDKNKSENTDNTPTFTPSFEPPKGLEPNGFQAIDDDEIPF